RDRRGTCAGRERGREEGRHVPGLPQHPGLPGELSRDLQGAQDRRPERQVHRRCAHRIQQGRPQAPDHARHRDVALEPGHGRRRRVLRAARQGRAGAGDATRAAGQRRQAARAGQLRLVPWRQFLEADRPELPQARRPVRRLPVCGAEGLPDRRQPAHRPQQRDHDEHGPAVHARPDQVDRRLRLVAARRNQDGPAARVPLRSPLFLAARRGAGPKLRALRNRFPPLMKRLFSLAFAGALFAAAAHAQTLRWSSQGDPQTMDPHSQNEQMTNMMNGQVYERLTNRDRQLQIVPGLATEWTQVSPLVWRFKLRPGVKFHDGSPFTADDVVFSILRGQEKTSQINNYAHAVGMPKKIDELTVEFDLPAVNPIFLQHLNALWIMSKSWCEKHNVTKPLDFANKEESYTSLHANGTGPYMLVSRAPGIKTIYKRNPNYWGRIEGNVQDIVFTPIENNATRTAALVSGEVDFVLDPPSQDLLRLRNTPGVKVIDGPENRIVFIGMDQGRDELLYSSVKGKNPFKDLRIRKALY